MDLTLNLPFLNKKGRGEPGLANDGVLLTSSQHGGRYYEAAKRGNIFIGSSAAAGSVLPIFSNTAQKFGLWNPSDSKVNLVLLKLMASYVDTTGAAGGFVLGHVKDAPPKGMATGANITAFTEGVLNTTIFNGKVGDSKAPQGKFTPSAATVTAPVLALHLGVNQLVLTAADATNPTFAFKADFDGEVIIPPGNALFLAGNIATLSKWAASVVWAEEDV